MGRPKSPSAPGRDDTLSAWGVVVHIQPTLRGSSPPARDVGASDEVAPPADPTLTVDIQLRLDAIERKLDRVLYELGQAKADQTRTHFTVQEAARALGKTTFTVREWCRLGRMNATKRAEKRGGAEMWNISAQEIERLRNEGLLPVDPARNLASGE